MRLKLRLPVLTASAGLLAFLLSFASLVRGPVAHADQQGRRIIYQKISGGNLTFHISKQDGASVIQAGQVNSPVGTGTYWARWSPDDTKIVWSAGSYSGDGIDIYVSDINGSSASMVNITNTPGVSEYIPMWQPGTDKIVYLQDETGGGRSLYAINSDGSGNHLLVNLPSSDTYDFSLSPDGSKIVFANGSGVSSHIYVANSDGSNLAQIADGAEPVFSPDSTKLAIKYYPTSDPAQTVVKVIGVDGSVEADLSDVPELVGTGLPSMWSPDGLRLIYASSIDPLRRNIFYTVISSKDTTQLTDRDGSNYPQFFSPDGTKIYFNTTDTPSSNYALYTVDWSGNVEQVIYEAGSDIVAYEYALEPEGSNNSGGNSDNNSGGNNQQNNGGTPGVPRTGAALGLGMVFVSLLVLGLLVFQQVENKRLDKDHAENKFH